MMRLWRLLWTHAVAFAVVQLLVDVVCCAANPMCRCGKPTGQRPVVKPGENKGKLFYHKTCGNSSPCNYFVAWVPEQQSSKKRQNPETQHKLVAFSSEEPMDDVTVYVVQIEPRNQLKKETELERFWNVLRAKTFHAKPFRYLEMTLRKPSSAVAAEAVFLEKPSGKVLEELASFHQDFPCSVRLSGTDTITADSDWDSYKALLMKTIWKQFPELRIKNTEFRFPQSSKLIPASYPGLPTEDCNVTRCVTVSLTCHKRPSFQKPFLLVSLQVIHDLGSTQTVDEMLARGTILIAKTIPGQPAQAGCEVRAIGGAKRAGILGEPKEHTTISQNRTSLGGRSLLDYNIGEYQGRRELLKSANSSSHAVGMHRHDGIVIDYPPQILEPVWKWGNLDKTGFSLKRSPAEWNTLTEKVALQIRNKVLFPSAFGIKLCEEMYDPGFLTAESPKLKDGPAAENVTIQPLLPQTNPDATLRLQQFFKSVKALMPKWTWLSPIAYDATGPPAKVRSELKDKLSDVPGGALVLAALPELGDKNSIFSGNRERDHSPKPDFWLSIKNAAATRVLRSQCFHFDQDCEQWWKQEQILLSVNAKCGGQHKLFVQPIAEQGTYFVALDLSRNQGPQGISVGCGTAVLGSNGRVLYLPADHRFQKGEKLSANFLYNFISDCLEEAETKFGEPIRRIVVSRDGRYQKDEKETILRVTEQYSCRADLVEVTKSGPDRIRVLQLKGIQGFAKNPESGKYFMLNNKTAVLTTTGEDTYTLAEGVIQPICITLVEGTTNLRQVVQEQYSLSRLLLYTSKPTRLPCHLHLADRAALDHLKGVRQPNLAGLHAA